MPTKNFPILQDTLLAKSGTAVGGGDDEHLPVGIGGGYNFRAALKFTLDWAGVTSITSARLYMRTTTKVHATSWGASPGLIVERLTEANWSENDGRSSYDSPAGSGWSASGTDYDSPNVQPGSNDTAWACGSAESTWYSVDITTIVKAWAPTSIPGGSGLSNTGILIRPSANTTAETVEFYSRKSAYDPYIVLTYVSNIAPTATVTAPVNNAKLLSTDLTPTMALAFVEAGSIASYDLQVTTDPAWATATHWNLAASTTGLAGTAPNWTASIPYGGTALVPGTVYYVRARATDNEGALGAWSPVISFRLNRPPSAAGGFGSAFVARVHNLTDLAAWTAVGSHAKPELKFTPTDLDSDPITGYEVRISLAGSPVSTDAVTGSFASGAQVTHLHTYALVNGTLYTVAFRSRDALEWGPWTAETNFRVRWGEAIYEAPTPAGSANWRITFGALAGDGASMSTSYRKATAASGGGTVTAWSASIPSPSTGFINVRVRVASSGTAPTQPALPDMTFTYDASAALPIGWTFPDTARAGLDTNVRRYGQNSIRMEANPSGAAVSAYQDIAVSEDTDYTFSAWAKVEADLVNCTVKVGVYTTAGVLLQEATMAAGVAVNEWHRITGHYHSAEGQTTLRFIIQIVGSSGAEGLVWFDAAMLDEGTVAGQWTPALVGLPVVIDAQGIIINSAAGGMLRIDGTVIKPAPYVGTDAPPGPTDGQLWWDTDDATLGPGSAAGSGSSFPVSPLPNEHFWRTDYDMEFYWDASLSLWLSTQLLSVNSSVESSSATFYLNLATTGSTIHRVPLYADVGTDIFIVSCSAMPYINAGGTALGASHKWVGSFMKVDAANAGTAIGSVTVDSGASANWHPRTAVINALLGGVANYPNLRIDWAKTGTPGDITTSAGIRVAYRLVAV